MKIEKQTILTTLIAINTFYSKTVNNMTVNRDLKSLKTNVAIIKQKNINDLKQYNNVSKSGNQEILTDFILNIAEKENIKINKAEYTRNFTAKNIKLSHFIDYEKMARYMHSNIDQWRHDGLIFNINNINSAIISFFIVLNTLYLAERGNYSKYYELANRLLHGKIEKFWIEGYYRDLLLHDRVSFFKDNHFNKIVYLKSYCSTQIMNEKDSIDKFYKNSGGMFNANNSQTFVL